MTSLVIAADQIRILNGDVSVGSSANVDTDGGMHTYRIVVSGTIAGSPVQIYHDGVLRLTGALYFNANASTTARIDWGENSSLAYGASEWEYVEHNANMASCVTPTRPTTWGRVKRLYR